MDKHYQKEINLGRMFKTLAERWTAILLSFVFALIAGASVGFFATFNKKIYGTDLDFYFYQIPTTDKDGNAIIGTATEYDEKTLNMIFENISSQSFMEAIFCDNGIPVAKEGQEDKLNSAIVLAKEKVDELDKARKLLNSTSLELALAKKTTETAKSAFAVEKEAYDAVSNEYRSALQAYGTALSSNKDSTDPTIAGLKSDVELFSQSLEMQKVRYNSTQTAYEDALKIEAETENEYEVCKQAIRTLNKEARDAKNEALVLFRQQEEHKEVMKKVAKCIDVSYVNNDSSNKSTIRVSVAVKNDEAFAKTLVENIQTQLPSYIIEKIDYNTANCEQTNVLAEVEQINENETITKTLTFGAIAGVVAMLIAAAVVLVKHKQEYIVLVPYDKEEM